jgi:exportin-1
MQAQLMSPPNATWREIIAQAAAQPDVLKQPEVVRNVQNILATNVSVASSLGHPFLSQIQLIYIDMLNLYKCAPLAPTLIHPLLWRLCLPFLGACIR